MIANLIGGFVTILIGVSLIGPIATQVNTAAATGGALYNSSTWGATVLQLVPGFFMIAIVLAATIGVWSALRNSGILGRDNDFNATGNLIQPMIISKNKKTTKKHKRKHL